MTKHDEWVPFSWHCPNCGALVTGYKNAEGTINEANIYSGIGMNKLLELTERRGCKFVVWTGRTRIIIRERLDDFIDKAYSI